MDAEETGLAGGNNADFCIRLRIKIEVGTHRDCTDGKRRQVRIETLGGGGEGLKRRTYTAVRAR